MIGKFGPQSGKYMLHCHNVVHEDHDMMTHFTVGSGDPIPREGPRRVPSPRRRYVADGGAVHRAAARSLP
jgi:spore coat protein A